MPRAIWTGTVSFGLVEIPVRLHAAIEGSEETRFSFLDKRDFAPVGYERVNKRTGAKVPWEQIVRGFEHTPGEYVVLTEEELREANAHATQTIDLLDFVDAAEIEPVFWETPYYLEPVKKESKSYVLLREVLRTSGKAAIAKVVLRTRQRLAALVVRDDAIVLNVLRYAHEIRDPATLNLPEKTAAKSGVSAREVSMAEALVKSMTGPWKPDRYHDEYREDVLSLVKKKVASGQSHEVTVPEGERPRPRRRGEVLDLMPLLEKSLRGRRKTASAAPRRQPRKTAKRRTAS